MVSHLPGRRLRERWCNAAKLDGIFLLPCSHAYCNTNSYTYTFTSGFTNGDTYAPNADGNCDSDSHTDCNRFTDTVRAISYSVTYAYGNSDCNGWATGYAHPTASSGSATAPLGFVCEKGTHC